MQKMLDIPATMPTGTDEADSKWHSRHIHHEEKKTVITIEYRVN
jgi:hypothetical protein